MSGIVNWIRRWAALEEGLPQEVAHLSVADSAEPETTASYADKVREVLKRYEAKGIPFDPELSADTFTSIYKRTLGISNIRSLPGETAIIQLLKNAERFEACIREWKPQHGPREVSPLITMRDPNGDTFLHHAVTIANPVLALETCKAATEAGADYFAKNNEGMTPLHLYLHQLATSKDVPALAPYLIQEAGKRGFKLSETDFHGRTLVHLAAMCYYTSPELEGETVTITELLFAHLSLVGFSSNQWDLLGCTAFDTALLFQRKKVIPLLLRHGADPVAGLCMTDTDCEDVRGRLLERCSKIEMRRKNGHEAAQLQPRKVEECFFTLFPKDKPLPISIAQDEDNTPIPFALSCILRYRAGRVIRHILTKDKNLVHATFTARLQGMDSAKTRTLMEWVWERDQLNPSAVIELLRQGSRFPSLT